MRILFAEEDEPDDAREQVEYAKDEHHHQTRGDGSRVDRGEEVGQVVGLGTGVINQAKNREDDGDGAPFLQAEEEVAQRLKKSASGVRATLCRAKVMLREKLGVDS